MNEADLTVVQLSDLHISSEGDIEAMQIADSFYEAIRSHSDSTRILLALTGDIAYSGQQEEYALAKQLIDKIYTSLSNDFQEVYLVILPGNHDVNLDIDPNREATLKGILLEPPPSENQLKALSSSQQYFFEFISSFEPITANWDQILASSLTIETSNGQISITALNTASCSKLKEKPNELFISLDILPSRSDTTACHVVLFHHPLHWLHESVRVRAADWISHSCEIALTGHEHEYDQMAISKKNLPTTQYIAGRAMYDKTASAEGFQIINIDLRARQIRGSTFSRAEGVYVASSPIKGSLSSASERDSSLRVRENYIRHLEELHLGILHKTGKTVLHSSIFVYPDIRFQASQAKSARPANPEYIDASILPERLLLEQRLLILGEEYAGKSFLIKQLFKDLLGIGCYPLIISGKSLKRRSISDVIGEAILMTYQLESEQEYFRLPKADRVLIIDDVDLVPDIHKALHDISEFASQHFGSYAFSCRELFLLRDPLTGDGNEELWKFATAQISAFSHVKQSELVARWVAHDPEITDIDRHTREVALESQLYELLAQKAVPALPMALTLILESMDSRDEIDESTGAFGYHYQRLILQGLAREQGRRARVGEIRVTDDTALELLGRLAYKVYAGASDELDQVSAKKVASDMKLELIIEFSTDAAIETLVGAGLLKTTTDGSLFFAYKYVYQFSIAKLLALWLNNDAHRDEVRSIIEGLIEAMDTEEGASILIFFTFLTRDSHTIRGIVTKASQIFGDLEPCDLGSGLDRFLVDAGSPRVLPSQDVRANRAELNRARDAETRDEEVAAIAELKQESQDAVKEIERAFRCMQVLGQILRAYPTRLSGDEKKVVAAECYKLGLRTLTEFVRAIENAEERVKHYFAKIAKGHVEAYKIEEFENELARQLSFYLQFGALGIIKRIARSVGSTHLRPLYGQVEIEGCARPVQIINRAIGLDLLGELRHNETADLFEELEKDKCRIAAGIVQALVWEYMFLHPVAGSTRQSILKRLHMVEHPSMLGNKYKQQKALPKHKSS